MELWLTISSDGVMTAAEMLRDLKEEKIAPILIFEQNGKITVPLFHHKNVAEKFAKRNTPKHCTIGTMLATESEMKQIAENGWETVVFDHPNKRNVRVEVLEIYDKDVETNASGYRRHI